jgi:hypothetical protein
MMVRILPKVGPLRALKVKMLNPQEQDILLKSVNTTDDDYHALLRKVQAAGPGLAGFTLAELDYDTGAPTAPGEYQLCDQTYARLLLQLTRPGAPVVPQDVRANILAYYANPGSNPSAKDFVEIKQPKKWVQVQAALLMLRAEPGTQVTSSAGLSHEAPAVTAGNTQ